jgi:hypothetical protein
MLLLVTATFVVTFLIVCAVAYLLLVTRSADPNAASQRGSKAGNAPERIGRRSKRVAVVDDDAGQVPLREQVVRTIKWLRGMTATGQAPANALPASPHRVPGLGVRVLLACVMLVLAAAAFLLVIAGMNQLFAWFVQPVIGYVFDLILPLLLTLEGSLLVATGVLLLGLPLARRFRRPERFRLGVICVTLAIATFWPLQYAAGSVELPFKEYNVALHGLALFASLCLLTGGLEAMRRASNTPDADSWEFLS